MEAIRNAARNDELYYARHLQDSNINQSLLFSSPGREYKIAPSDYDFVGLLIQDELVDIKWFDGPRPNASYKASKATIYLNRDLKGGGVQRIERLSTLIHEVTHVIQDLNDESMSREISESMAHIAQAIYLLKRGITSFPTKRRKAAAECAKQIIDTGRCKRGAWDELTLWLAWVYDKDMDQDIDWGNRGI